MDFERYSLGAGVPVALRKGAWIEMDWSSVISAMTGRRSPQGERG